jgi:hypothetical protein
VQAGYFEVGKDRLVKPAVVGLDAALKPSQDPEAGSGSDHEHADPDGSGQDGGVQTHPLMVGLLQSLPELGSKFPERDRERWLNAVRVNFDFMYGPAEDAESGPLSLIRDPLDYPAPVDS